MSKHVGIIRHIDPEMKIGYITKENTGEKKYLFTFGKIRGYRGEELQQKDWHVGARVNFTIGDTDQVLELELYKP